MRRMASSTMDSLRSGWLANPELRNASRSTSHLAEAVCTTALEIHPKRELYVSRAVDRARNQAEIRTVRSRVRPAKDVPVERVQQLSFKLYGDPFPHAEVPDNAEVLVVIRLHARIAINARIVPEPVRATVTIHVRIHKCRPI